jgi:hypothetical protein
VDLDRLTCLDPGALFALKLGSVRLGDIPKEMMAAHRGIERVQWILAKAAKQHSAPEQDEAK